MPKIRALEERDLTPLLKFTDREIGAGYYSPSELTDIFKRSQQNGVMYTLVLESDQGEIEGVRITFPPRQWQHGKGHGLNPERWPHGLQHTAYFQSLFLAAHRSGQGWGGKLSSAALELLKRHHAKGVVCHSWKESPHNSSTRHLQKLGFKTVAEHPLYWSQVNYNCTRCLKPPCQCTAQEMYLDLETL